MSLIFYRDSFAVLCKQNESSKTKTDFFTFYFPWQQTLTFGEEKKTTKNV